MKKNILLLGAYGQKNIGDEALLLAAEGLIKDVGDFNISSNSSDLQFSEKEFPEISFFSTNIRENFFSFIKTFFKSNVIIFGGGSLLVELKMVTIDKRTPLYRILILNLIGKILGKKIVFLGVGAEYVSKGLSSHIMKFIMKLTNIFIMRDEFSSEVVRYYGAPEKRVISSPDIVHSLETSSIISVKETDIENIGIIPVCRIPERDDYYEHYIKSLSLFITEQINNGKKIHLIPMRYEESDDLNDLVVIQQILDLIEEKNPGVKNNIITYPKYKSPKDFGDLVDDLDVVLSSRFHGLIYGISHGKHVISLSEFKKSDYLLKESGLGDFSLMSKDVSVEKLTSLIKKIDSIKNNENILKIKNKKTGDFNRVKSILKDTII